MEGSILTNQITAEDILKKSRTIFYILLFLTLAFYLWLASRIPYTFDDWYWGTDLGYRMFINAETNSRYSGNFIEFSITRIPLLKTVVMGTVFFMIPFLITRFASGISWKAVRTGTLAGCILFSCCNILILTMPAEIWRETYSWAAGFANFVVPEAFVCWYFIAIEELFIPQASPEKIGMIRCIANGILCVLMQMFIENLTVYILLISFCALVISVRRTKSLQPKYILMFLGHLVGAFIMFSSSIYQSLLQTGTAVDGYRTLTFSWNDSFIVICAKLISWFFNEDLVHVFHLNWLPLSIVFILMLFLPGIKKDSKLNTLSHKLIHIAGILWFVLCYGLNACSTLALWIQSLISVLFYCIIFADISILFAREKALCRKLLLVWLSVLASVIPMAILVTYNDRSFLIAHFFLTLFITLLVLQMLKGANKKTELSLFFAFGVVLLFLCAFLGKIYYDIGETTKERENRIAVCIETRADTLVLPKYPYGIALYDNYVNKYLTYPNPVADTWTGHFKEFYHLPPETKIEYME